MNSKENELGLYFRQGRTHKALTLRAVEEAVGISNAYLSQLESGKIQRPSPSILHKLCELYGISYTIAMELAGYPTFSAGTDVPSNPQFVGRLGQTTKEEEEALLEYLAFLRSRRK